MPMLVLTGEKAAGEFLITQGQLVADNVEGVVVARVGALADGGGAGPGHPQARGLSHPLETSGLASRSRTSSRRSSRAGPTLRCSPCLQCRSHESPPDTGVNTSDFPRVI